MECKHFSHPHNLSLHQIEQAAEINCSGCHFPCSGSVYICRKCKFFLHEQCFHASRSMKHPSHPSHSLALVPYPTYPSGSFFCDSCNLAGTGFSFSCSQCDFDLHVHCASMPKKPTQESSFNSPTGLVITNSSSQAVPVGDQAQLARVIQHKSHPKHRLTLLSPPPYDGDKFTCDACGEIGNDCTFHCETCNFDLHFKCASSSLPERVTRENHEHPLSLYYSVQLTEESAIFLCDVCDQPVPENLWVYYCTKCDYGTHLNCVKAERLPKEESSQLKLDDPFAVQAELFKIQGKMQMNNILSHSVNSMFYIMRS